MKPPSTINPGIFREYDIRGIADQDLSIEFAELLGRTFPSLFSGLPLGGGRTRLKISVGWDARLSSEKYCAALVRGLSLAGADVVQLGLCPTPLTYFSLFHLDVDGSIMITGSHNPAEYNGFKLCVGKTTIHGKQIQALRLAMEKTLATTNAKSVTEAKVSNYPIIPHYIDHLIKNVRHVKRKKIVIDAGNATASIVAPELFRRLGAEVIPLYCTIDGRFPNHHPDPTVPENLADLIATVKKEQAEFGIAFDGDSDRIGVVDEAGRILYGDELMVIFSRDILREKKNATIISEVKCSYRLYDDIAKNGGNPIMWKTGHSLIKSKMKETRAALAGEMSGHMFFADRYFGYDDAIYAALRLYEIASDHPGPLSSLISDLPSTVNTPELRVNCLDEKKFQLVEETKRLLMGSGKIIDIDGVRVDFGDGWGLVRASNTQPVLVLRFEASTSNRLGEIRSVVEGALHRAAKTLGHPTVSTPTTSP